jgi:hypothetical protein
MLVSRHQVLAFCVAAVLSVSLGCSRAPAPEQSPQVIEDYAFAVDGTVTDVSGTPLSGVRVVLDVSADLFNGVTPFGQAVETTHDDGSFEFYFLSGVSNPPYFLLFEKQGYFTATLEPARGSMGPHTVVLHAVASRQ